MSRGTVAIVLAPAAFGGLEKVVWSLADGVAAEGWGVILIVLIESGVEVPAWARDLEASGIIVESVVSSRRGYWQERRAVAELLDRHGVDIVHTHGDRVDVLHGLSAVSAGRIAVTTAHGFSRSGLKGRLIEWAHARAMARFRAVVAVSRPLSDALVRRGVSSAKVVLIANGLPRKASPRSSRESARSELGLGQDRRVIGWVGRFSREKDPGFQVRAFAAMRDREAVLCMIGDGPELGATRSLAQQLGVSDRVMFAGARNQASALFGAFDVFGLSSSTEGTPIVLLEAMEAGLRIVATRVGGVPDLVGDSARLVDHGDLPAMSAALDASLASVGGAAMDAHRIDDSAGGSRSGWLHRYSALYSDLLAHR